MVIFGHSVKKKVQELARTSMASQSTTPARVRARLQLTCQHLVPNRCVSNSSQHDVKVGVTGIPASSITNVNQGTKYTNDFRNYAINKASGKVVSYFHDIPLDLNHETKTANMVVEIPRWTNAKFEISKELPGNPIIQDTKKGQIRFVRNLFPHHGYIHNYGAFPQTWEDPTMKHDDMGGIVGDNDPLDVCEIGSSVKATGDIKRVKILGAIALIDDGELDWKVIAVDVSDPLAQELSDIHDVFVVCPGLLETTRQWFRDYKKPDGKPENEFAFNATYKNQAETLEIMQENYDHWKKLLSGEINGALLPATINATHAGSPQYLENGFDQLLNNPPKPDAPIPVEIQKSYYCASD